MDFEGNFAGETAAELLKDFGDMSGFKMASLMPRNRDDQVTITVAIQGSTTAREALVVLDRVGDEWYLGAIKKMR